jgi:hypothetical protein
MAFFLSVMAIMTELPSSEHSPRYTPADTASSRGELVFRAAICPFLSAYRIVLHEEVGEVEVEEEGMQLRASVPLAASTFTTSGTSARSDRLVVVVEPVARVIGSRFQEDRSSMTKRRCRIDCAFTTSFDTACFFAFFASSVCSIDTCSCTACSSW